MRGGFAMITSLAVWTVFCLAVGLLTVHAEASKPVPESEWSPETALWLARAQVGEAGWTGYLDHDAMAWVLARRWRAAPPGTRFVTVVKQYCNSLDEHRPRAAWLRNLEDSSLVPEGWPITTRWNVREPQWKEIRMRAELWFAGEIPDPTGGRAMHWDTRSAPMPKGCRLIADVGTLNAFYECGR